MNADFITSVPKLRLRSGALGHGPGIVLLPQSTSPDLTAAGESPGGRLHVGVLAPAPILPPPPLSPDTQRGKRPNSVNYWGKP